MSELKKCPFCGGNRAYIIEKSTTITITCPQCHAMIEDVLEEDAVNKWNNRKPVDDVLERLNKELFYAIDEKKRCKYESPLKFNSAKGYENAISNAITIIKTELGG